MDPPTTKIMPNAAKRSEMWSNAEGRCRIAGRQMLSINKPVRFIASVCDALRLLCRRRLKNWMACFSTDMPRTTPMREGRRLDGIDAILKEPLKGVIAPPDRTRRPPVVKRSSPLWIDHSIPSQRFPRNSNRRELSKRVRTTSTRFNRHLMVHTSALPTCCNRHSVEKCTQLFQPRGVPPDFEAPNRKEKNKIWRTN